MPSGSFPTRPWPEHSPLLRARPRSPDTGARAPPSAPVRGAAPSGPPPPRTRARTASTPRGVRVRRRPAVQAAHRRRSRRSVRASDVFDSWRRFHLTVDELAKLPAGSVQPRANGSHGAADDLADFLVAEIFDVGEQHDFTLLRREFGERFRDRFAEVAVNVFL